ncbi:MAG: PEP-CTERM sorting domain-containing protein [Phycisphaerae bacterium]|jgi:hypothetical protein
MYDDRASGCYLTRASLSAVLLLLLATAVAARADPFYLRYDADEVYPEDAGWERHGIDPHGLVVRTLGSGILTIDSRASLALTDWYLREIPELEIQDGEQLRVTWRMRTFETQTEWFQSDVVLAVSNAESEYVEFFLGPDFIAVNEDGLVGPEQLYLYSAETWHTFQMISDDAQAYTLLVDGEYAFDGTFTRHLSAGPNLAAFGDAIYGRSSLSSWDYIEFEVVPEPTSALLVAAAGAVSCAMNRRERRT